VSSPILERATVIDDEHILVEWKNHWKVFPKPITSKNQMMARWWDYLSDEDQSTFSFEDFMVNPDQQSYFYRLKATDSCDFTGEYSNHGKAFYYC
jgi:hypothetical protein